MGSPVLTVAEMRSWESASWAAGVDSRDVIRRVGVLIARKIMSRTRSGDRIIAVAGKGNNGDDTRAAAAALHDRDVVIVDVSDPVTALPQLADVLARPAAMVLDGVFGIGVDRPLEGPWADIMRMLDSAKGLIVAIDVPSGLNADTGTPFGTAVHAHETWTVGAPKVGLLASPAAPHVGRLELIPDIGLVGKPVAASPLHWVEADDFSDFPPRRPADGNKGTFGHAVLIAGSSGYHGAAVLAVRGMMRARPGLSTVFVQPEILAVVAAQVSAPIVRGWLATTKIPDNATSVTMGPGLASKEIPAGVRDIVTRLWRTHDGPVVADASALDWLAPRPAGVNVPRILTPHPGEAARMLDSNPAAIQRDRLASLRELSRRLGNLWVVLKGYQTLVGRSEGPVFVNSSGNPGLAQGGTGDVLAGFLGGLLAQPHLCKDVARTVSYGVWQHGLAADLLEQRSRNWTAEELAAQIGA